MNGVSSTSRGRKERHKGLGLLEHLFPLTMLGEWSDPPPPMLTRYSEGKDQIYQEYTYPLASVDYILNEERKKFFKIREKYGGVVAYYL